MADGERCSRTISLELAALRCSSAWEFPAESNATRCTVSPAMDGTRFISLPTAQIIKRERESAEPLIISLSVNAKENLAFAGFKLQANARFVEIYYSDPLAVGEREGELDASSLRYLYTSKAAATATQGERETQRERETAMYSHAYDAPTAANAVLPSGAALHMKLLSLRQSPQSEVVQCRLAACHFALREREKEREISLSPSPSPSAGDALQSVRSMRDELLSLSPALSHSLSQPHSVPPPSLTHSLSSLLSLPQTQTQAPSLQAMLLKMQENLVREMDKKVAERLEPVLARLDRVERLLESAKEREGGREREKEKERDESRRTSASENERERDREGEGETATAERTKQQSECSEA